MILMELNLSFKFDFLSVIYQKNKKLNYLEKKIINYRF
jgi:hypothetical protein